MPGLGGSAPIPETSVFGELQLVTGHDSSDPPLTKNKSTPSVARFELEGTRQGKGPLASLGQETEKDSFDDPQGRFVFTGLTPGTGCTPHGPSSTNVRPPTAFLSRAMRSSKWPTSAPPGSSMGRS